MTNIRQQPETESEIQFCIDRNLEGLHPWQIHLLEQLDKSLVNYREATTIPTLGGNNNTGMKAGYTLHDNPRGLHGNDTDGDVYIDISLTNLSPFGELSTLTEGHMAKNIETVVLIRGVDANNMSDDAILDMITDLEGQIKRYKDMKTTTATASKKVAALQEDIKALVAFVDDNDDDDADA